MEEKRSISDYPVRFPPPLIFHGAVFLTDVVSTPVIVARKKYRMLQVADSSGSYVACHGVEGGRD